MAAETPRTPTRESRHDAFRFMELPRELRVMVYKFATQEFTDSIMSLLPDGTTKPRLQPFRGVLALLHTSSFVRLESCEAIWSVLYTRLRGLLNLCLSVSARMREHALSEIADRPTCARLNEQHGELSRQYDYMYPLSRTLLKVEGAALRECRRREYVVRLQETSCVVVREFYKGAIERLDAERLATFRNIHRPQPIRSSRPPQVLITASQSEKCRVK
jgi:hypothetical protein